MHRDDEIVLNQVLRLNTVFDENSVAHHVINHVVLDPQVTRSMDRNGSVVCRPDGVASDVRIVEDAELVEVDRISSLQASLSGVSELDVLDSADCGARSVALKLMEHDMCAVTVSASTWQRLCALHYDASRQKADLSSQRDLLRLTVD